ncbi:MAG TPA: hypothetical protein VM715_11110, partial [Candidatus Acidoferrum sp.]|nr:hypothetical protein [Candidatus Acidoferrum sp.]
IRTFIVDPQAGFRQSTPREELTNLAATDIRRLMNVTSNPIGATVACWPDSMPQYTVGHQARADRIRDFEEKCRGLYLCSNYFDGVGIPDCVRRAEQTAQRITAKLA